MKLSVSCKNEKVCLKFFVICANMVFTKPWVQECYPFLLFKKSYYSFFQSELFLSLASTGGKNTQDIFSYQSNLSA